MNFTTELASPDWFMHPKATGGATKSNNGEIYDKKVLNLHEQHTPALSAVCVSVCVVFGCMQCACAHNCYFTSWRHEERQERRGILWMWKHDGGSDDNPSAELHLAKRLIEKNPTEWDYCWHRGLHTWPHQGAFFSTWEPATWLCSQELTRKCTGFC